MYNYDLHVKRVEENRIQQKEERRRKKAAPENRVRRRGEIRRTYVGRLRGGGEGARWVRIHGGLRKGRIKWKGGEST
jgi:hypothetical protein